MPVSQVRPSAHTEQVPSAAQVNAPPPHGAPSGSRPPVGSQLGPLKVQRMIPSAQRSSGGEQGAPSTQPSRLASGPLRQKMLSVTPGGHVSV